MKTILLLTVALLFANDATWAATWVQDAGSVGEAADATDAAVPAEELPTIMLRMKSGGILWGSIVAHDPDAVRFRRLDNGGTVKLPWSHLDPKEEHDLRLRFGYVDAAVEELMTKADRIFLKDGTEVVGLIQSRNDEYIFIKQGANMKPVLKAKVAGPVTLIEVPALDVYTKEELYQSKVFEYQSRLILDGAPGAQAHYEVAQYAERLFDYPHAVLHYQIAVKLDPTFEADVMSVALERAEAKAVLQEQVDVLAAIDLWRARKRYDRALELLTAFPATYPNSPLMEDWNKLRLRVDRYQERDLRKEVIIQWHKWASRLARAAPREHKTYEAVVGYLDEQMGEDLLQKVQEAVQQIAPDIETDEVRRLWEERKGGKYRQASFGLGTWLLGEERALAVPEKAKDPSTAPKKGSQGEARKKLEDKIERYLKNQELTKKAKGGGDEEDDPELFWSQWSSAGRRQWILAYYVEYSGDFTVARIRFSNCRECGGTGGREVIFTGGAIAGQVQGSRIVPCPTCHTIGRVRRVRYR